MKGEEIAFHVTANKVIGAAAGNFIADTKQTDKMGMPVFALEKALEVAAGVAMKPVEAVKKAGFSSPFEILAEEFRAIQIIAVKRDLLEEETIRGARGPNCPGRLH